MDENKPEWLIIHHTGGTSTEPLADTSHHTLEIVNKYHKSLGWEMIGYHYFIEKGGALRKGRPEHYHGAHTLGYNRKSIGICLAGNFDLTLPTEEQITTLTGLLTALKKAYSIPSENIVPHRKFAKKTCYGSKLADNWAEELVKPKFTKEDIIKRIDELKAFILNNY